MTQDELKMLYAMARQALADQDYQEATTLLKKILLLDENYRDASQLLAQIVRRKRRPWYKDLRLLGVVIGMIAIGLLIWLVPKLGRTIRTTTTTEPSPVPSPTLTAQILAWKRISMGQEFYRNNITSIVVDPKDPDVIYFGTQGAGIYKTINSGISWQPTHSGLETAFISKLIIDPQDHNTLYASGGRGVYKTTDGGLNWRLIFQIDHYGGVLAMGPGNPGRLYTLDGSYSHETKNLYESTDGGSSWNTLQTPSCSNAFARIALHPDKPEILYLHFTSTYIETQGRTCTWGFYKSEDGGKTWNLTPANISIRRLYIQSQPEESIYATDYGRGLFRSLDLGKTWGLVSDKPCYALTFDPNHPERIFCGTEGALMLTEDNAKTWRTAIESEGFFFSVVLSPNAVLAGGMVGTGFYVSQDGGSSWVERTDGVGAIAFNLHIPGGSDGPWFVEGESGIFRSTDQGKSWNVIDRRGAVSAFAVGEEGNSVYRMGEDNTTLLRSIDGGETWQSHALPTNGWGIGGICQLTSTVFISNPDGYYLSTDGGKTWDETFKDAWTQMQFPSINIPKIYSDDTCQHLFVISPGDQMLFSKDGGANWGACGSMGSFPPTTMALDPSNSQRIIAAAAGGGIFISKDGCQSWKPSNTGLGSLYVSTIVIDPNHPDTFYAGTDGGAYISFDGGETWEEVNDGLLGATVVFSIDLDKDGNVYAATPYGIFRLEGR